MKVTIEEVFNDRAALEAEMAKAANDPLFQADVAEVMEDFKYVDGEYLDEDEGQEKQHTPL